MAPQDGVCQLSGQDQSVFTYVLTRNDSPEQGSCCMASAVVMHCPVPPLAYVFSMVLTKDYYCKANNIKVSSVLFFASVVT